MTPVTKQLLEKALKLTGSEREALAASLFESLERDQDGQDEDAAAVQAEWNEEISKRISELDSGRVTPIPWSIARRMIRGEHIDDSVGS
jgi:putative addiction module component (TIGR02574 family)